MTKVISLFSGPGTGKSTTAASLFSKMKLAGHNVELVTEFAKNLVWSDRQACMKCQPYLFGEQYYRIFTLLNKVEYVINDSPLLLSMIYNTQFKHMDSLVLEVFHSMDNISILLERTNRKYNEKGRNQTLDEAIEIDNMIHIMLDKHNIPYITVPADENAPHVIYEHIKFLAASSQLTNL